MTTQPIPQAKRPIDLAMEKQNRAVARILAGDVSANTDLMVADSEAQEAMHGLFGVAAPADRPAPRKLGRAAEQHLQDPMQRMTVRK